MSGDASNDLLRELVAAAAAPKAPVAEVVTVPMIALRIGARWFAVAADRVREVVTLESITSVPGVVDGVVGVALVRGRLVPVIDVPRMLDITRGGDAAITRPRLVVLTQGDDEAGVVADETRGVLELPPPAQAGSGLVRGELRWNGNIVGLLDAETIVAVVRGAR
jgi:chemotaxis signal transduction protein